MYPTRYPLPLDSSGNGWGYIIGAFHFGSGWSSGDPSLQVLRSWSPRVYFQRNGPFLCIFSGLWQCLVGMVLDYFLNLSCCCSAPKSCFPLCDPMDCSPPGLPIPHHLPELAQVHVHWVSDAIQPSHHLSPPSFYPLSFPELGCSQEAELFAYKRARSLESDGPLISSCAIY